MRYDFIEIGTSNFETIASEGHEGLAGICVEPVKHYLNQIPERTNIKKLNAAIVENFSEKKTFIHYIPEEVIDERKMPEWMKGCNSIQAPHPHHERYLDLVEKDEVDVYSFSQLVDMFNIENAEFIKVDTEGCDIGIAISILKEVKKTNKKFFPKTIRFEASPFDFSPYNYTYEIVGLAKEIGYNLSFHDRDGILRAILD
tara:strand:+ start:152 stop:751 length:600 start_codon:yes stop_codon:yes gene_type:complete